ncbi:DELLA protein SLN1-like [Malania oleifera]|uniref:DELLA protein SLN1-like n=1 Tax=Malania oleifera TaxID=397392 RepID=UPI0025AE3554|nr:DELLA protein SLN1-like [Malania oleifera]
MGPYDSASSSGSSSSCPGKPSPSDLDDALADAGYRVRSSDLRQVAHRLQRLETVMDNAPSEIPHLTSDAVHYNPSDLNSWVHSMLSVSEPHHPPPLPSDLSDFSDLPYIHGPPQQLVPTNQQNQFAAVTTAGEEDSGIRLVHTLVSCAESVQRGELPLARCLIDELQALLARVNTACGIGKVARCFIDALTRRIFGPPPPPPQAVAGCENDILYHSFYEACPYLKFAHFTANQAILEAFNGCDCVHVVDFNLMQGLQWPALIQALALRPGGPPKLRLTGIGPPSPDGRDSLREIGIRLGELARSVNVGFAFRGVAAARLDDVQPWMIHVRPEEALAVNSILQLHRLLGSDATRVSPINSVLRWIRELNPKIMTVVEQEANHNQPGFLERFTEALYYYSTVFDSLEVCPVQPERTVAEMYIQREICNVVCCEGLDRVERHEPLAEWRGRLRGAGFRPVHLGSNAFKQASMLLSLFSAEGYCVEENEGCLTLGWHSRPLIAASAWQVAPPVAAPAATNQRNVMVH